MRLQHANLHPPIPVRHKSEGHRTEHRETIICAFGSLEVFLLELSDGAELLKVEASEALRHVELALETLLTIFQVLLLHLILCVNNSLREIIQHTGGLHSLLSR